MGQETETGTPDKRAGIAALAVLIIALVILFTGSWSGETAGWALFVAIPASIGAILGMFINPDGRWAVAKFLLVPTAFILGFALIGRVAFGEGAICIAMVLPVWIPAGIGGGLTILWNRRHARRRSDGLYSIAWVALPFMLLVAERERPVPWTEHVVERRIVLAASADKVWPLLLSIPSIGPGEGIPTLTHDWLAVPRPAETRLLREGSILVRKARWGDDIRFDERIVAEEPGRRLAWRFAFPDDSVRRHTDRHISPDGPILAVTEGAYWLRPVSGGTEVVLETRYRMRSSFRGYLQWWGERLLGDVQENVLAIVAERVRAGSGQPVT
jgi:hypothetical protein